MSRVRIRNTTKRLRSCNSFDRYVAESEWLYQLAKDKPKKQKKRKTSKKKTKRKKKRVSATEKRRLVSEYTTTHSRKDMSST